MLLFERLEKTVTIVAAFWGVVEKPKGCGFEMKEEAKG